jgi:hypothetical protein
MFVPGLHLVASSPIGGFSLDKDAEVLALEADQEIGRSA